MRRIDEIAGQAQYNEKAIEAYLVKRVKELGGIALKYSNPSQTGYPDRLCKLPDTPSFWVELKSKGKKPRPIQQKRIEELREVGWIAFVADSKEEIDAILEIMN